MIARDLLNDSIPPLKESDTALKALDWMNEFRVSHLPVIKENEYLGLISEEDILNMNNPKKQLSKLNVNYLKSFIYEDKHVYEAVKMIANQKISVLPVLNNKDEYQGILTPAELLAGLAEIAAIEGVGGIVELELNIHDYSLSQIARIIESNDARILSVYTTSHPDSTKLELTIKIDQMDLSRILSSFARFNYVVKNSFHESSFSEDTQARYDSLMNFLKD